MTKTPDPRDRDDLSAELSAWLDGELSPAEASALEEELARDPALRAERDRLAALSSALRDLPTLRAPSSVLARVREEIAPVPGPSSRFASWAALILVALLGFVWWRLEVTRPAVFEGKSLAKEESAGAALEANAPARAGADASVPGVDLAPPPSESAVEESNELAAALRRATEESAPAPTDEGAAGAGLVAGEGRPVEKPAEKPAEKPLEKTAQRQDQWSGAERGAGRTEREDAPTLPGAAAKSRGQPPGGAPPPAAAAGERAAVAGPAIRFRSARREALDPGTPAADLAIRVAVPEGIVPADLDRLAATLAAALAPSPPPPPASEPTGFAGGGSTAEPVAPTGLAGAAREAAPSAIGGAGTLPGEPAELLPADVALEIPADRLLGAVGELLDWRRAVVAAAGEAPAERSADREGATGTEEAFLEVTILGGFSFDADPATLEGVLRELVAGPRIGGSAGEIAARRERQDAGRARDAAGDAPRAPGAAGIAPAAAPLRVRIILVADRPPEPPR